jgi:hypothetical protein
MTATFDDSFDGVGPGSTFFKPVEHVGSHALLIEPFEFDAHAENPFFDANLPEGPGNQKTRKEARAKLTIFGSPEALAANAPIVIPNALFSQPILADDLGQRLGKVAVFTVHKGQGKGGRQGSWKFAAVQQHVAARVKEYYLKREELASAPAADDDTPDYLKG